MATVGLVALAQGHLIARSDQSPVNFFTMQKPNLHDSTIRFLSRAGIVVVVFLAAVVLLNRPSADQKTKAAPAARSGPPATGPGIPAGTSILSARSVAENFTRATTHAERLKWVRQPGEVAAAMEDFFTSGSGSREQVAEISGLPPEVTDALASDCFGVRMDTGDLRLLCVVNEGGEAKVDFKAYARQGSQPWAALLNGQAREAAEMRVFIQPGEYYNFGFSDETRWQNFTVTSPDLEPPAQFFYLERSDPALKRLEKLDTRNPVRVTVAIRAVGDSHLHGQFEITRFLGAGWVMPE